MPTGRMIIAGLALALMAARAAAAPAPPYLDPERPLSTRVADLIARMTLAEKVAQLSSTAPAIIDDTGREVRAKGRFRLTIGGVSPGARAEALGAADPAEAALTVE